MDSVLNKKEVICGIYVIEFILSGKLYIGQSININERFREHKTDLRLNSHYNKKLQRYYNKFGLNCFRFRVLARVEEQKLNFWEKYYIKMFDTRKDGFNLTEGGKLPPIDKQKIPIRLINADTKETGEAESISAFARKYNECISNISQLIRKESKHANGWYDPAFWNPTYYTLVSPEGIKHTFWRIKEFAKKMNLSQTGVQYLINKKTHWNKGWSRPDSPPQKSTKKALIYKLISPSGDIFEGESVYKLAKEQGLRVESLRRIVRGERATYKGWKNFN